VARKASEESFVVQLASVGSVGDTFRHLLPKRSR